MLDVLAASPLLTIMLVLALGTVVGQIPFGPIRFGPAGALFVGLAIGALDTRLGEGLGGRLLGISPAIAAGSFAGALTSTPALAAVVQQVGNEDPAVGYSISYPVGVVVLRGRRHPRTTG